MSVGSYLGGQVDDPMGPRTRSQLLKGIMGLHLILLASVCCSMVALAAKVLIQR